MGALYLDSIGFDLNKISKLIQVPLQTTIDWVRRRSVPHEVIATTHVAKENEKRIKSKRMKGSRNPMWKGYKATHAAGRMRARGEFGVKDGYEIHHLDGDPLNNDPSNIVYLTRREHMLLDGRMKNRDKKGRFRRKEHE